MTTLQLLIICVSAIVLAPILTSRSRFATSSPRIVGAGATVVVHTLDGRSIRGVVSDEQPDVLPLSDAAYLVDGQSHPLGGIVHIPAGNVAFVQQLAAAPSPTPIMESVR